MREKLSPIRAPRPLPYYSVLGWSASSSARAGRKTRKNVIAAAMTEMKSLTGSARNTANTLFSKNCGRRKIRGMSKMIFRRQAMNRDAFALPMAIRVCCTDI